MQSCLLARFWLSSADEVAVVNHAAAPHHKSTSYHVHCKPFSIELRYYSPFEGMNFVRGEPWALTYQKAPDRSADARTVEAKGQPWMRYHVDISSRI